MFVQRSQQSHHHHVFLPQSIGQLQMISFESHPAAVTMHTLIASDDKEVMASIGVLVPQKSSSSKTTPMSITPRPSVPSRYWESHTFVAFGSSEVDRATPSISSGSSVSEYARRDGSISLNPDTLSKSRARGNCILVAPDKTDRVKKWVTQSSISEIDIELSNPFELHPSKPQLLQTRTEEQKPVQGLLKRRVKPKCHQTMVQKAAPGNSAAMKQAILEDYWLKEFAASKLQPKKTQVDKQSCSTPQAPEPSSSTATDVGEAPKPSMTATRRGDSHEIEEIFDAMQPALEAAKCFPGALELEAHIELVTVDTFSNDRRINNDRISLSEWRKIFQPDKHRPVSSYQIWDRITASGADVDSIVDLTWSKKKAKRMFEEETTDRGIVYEWYCHMKHGFAFVIALDENGQASLRQTDSDLCSSTMHFPHRTWDLNLILRGSMNLYHNLQDPKFDAAINDFVKSVRLHPGSSLEIYGTEPANRLFSVDKILMKRWTRHKHIPADQEAESNLMLKVVEVQEFVMGRNSNNAASIRGRISIDDRHVCASNQRLWFEVSIVSDEIQKLLTSNRELELGQKTDKWDPVDLLGDEVELKGISAESSPTARAIGSSGLGNMFRLGKSLLDRVKISE